MIRFDYADEDYPNLAHQAYQSWRDEDKYEGIFYRAPYILVGNTTAGGRSWIDRTTAGLDKRKLPWSMLDDAVACKQQYLTLTGELASPGFLGYVNKQAGWADATKAVSQLRDECLELGVSFICGDYGTVTGFETETRTRLSSQYEQKLEGRSQATISCSRWELGAPV